MKYRQSPSKPLAPEAQLPEWARQRWQDTAHTHALRLSVRLNPFLQRGDFNGDGKQDLALLVEHIKTQKIGIVFLHRTGSQVHIVGAGTPLGNGGDNFDWVDTWIVQEPSTKPPQHRSDALLLAKEGSASALVVFEKGAYRWHQLGD